jgi:hypothetical protein
MFTRSFWKDSTTTFASSASPVSGQVVLREKEAV